MENFGLRQNRELEYTEEFREFLRNNPGALKSFLKLEKEIEENSTAILESREEKVFEDENVKITPLYKAIEDRNLYSVINGRDKIPANSFCKVEIGDRAYFVKTIPGYFNNPEESTGTDEFRTIMKAKETLSGLEDVEIVEPQLGYRDKNTDRTYFVSEWKDLPNIATFLKSVTSTGEPKKGYRLINRFMDIEARLSAVGIKDVHTTNMFYDESTDKIYLFDLFDDSYKKR
ncbi:MAG: hypothetical protein RLY43_45 [Bacteroidota bacterium]|jgi:hypothetical protein